MCQAIYGIDTGSQLLTVFLPDNWRRDGTGKFIVAHHGRGETSNGFEPSTALPVRHDHIRRWADHGVAVVCPDLAAVGSYTWGSDDAIAKHDDAVTYARSSAGIVYGHPTAKYGLFGYSGGGLVSWNVLKRRAASIAAAVLWAPVSDLSWADGLGGYTPPYTTAVVPQAGWQAEINAAYGNVWANSAGHRVMDEPASYAGLGVPVKVIVPSDDTVVAPEAAPYLIGQINDPNIVLRTPQPTGGHTNAFVNVPTDETLTFYGAHL